MNGDLIGSINFGVILNEEQVRSARGQGMLTFKKVGICEVQVYSGEGQVPHFHIVKNNGKEKDCCVCIYTNTYFDHGTHVDLLNNNQLQQLNKWLNEPNKINKSMSNWNYIVLLWEKNNPDCLFDQALKVTQQPDYSKMNNITYS